MQTKQKNVKERKIKKAVYIYIYTSALSVAARAKLFRIIRESIKLK